MIKFKHSSKHKDTFLYNMVSPPSAGPPNDSARTEAQGRPLWPQGGCTSHGKWPWKYMK